MKRSSAGSLLSLAYILLLLAVMIINSTCLPWADVQPKLYNMFSSLLCLLLTLSLIIISYRCKLTTLKITIIAFWSLTFIASMVFVFGDYGAALGNYLSSLLLSSVAIISGLRYFNFAAWNLIYNIFLALSIFNIAAPALLWWLDRKKNI